VMDEAATIDDVPYRWRLREVMATRGVFTTADLASRLADQGVELSRVQVWRLITGTPERLSLQVLAALCSTLDVTPAELIGVTSRASMR
jgi:DNA-binding Xre family transcriptional regulator